ncbi:MAG: ABC transporter permease subunit [Chloroflexi bacterium]|nr:ABC transporter permease subunit [Chloroflexota bacterium]
MIGVPRAGSRKRIAGIGMPSASNYVMVVLILVFGVYVIAPVLLIFVNSFNVAGIGEPTNWALDNWKLAFSDPQIFKALRNTFMIFGLYTLISFPLAVLVAWAIARTRVKWAYGLEFMFWVSFMIPTISVTIGWTFLMDPDVGMLNRLFEFLPFVENGPFNIYSVPGIIWVHLMANATSGKVMLLVPAFRNMNVSLEEAGRVSGASNFRTMLRVTLPLMVPAMTVVFMLQLVRIFQSFETEQILGTPINFYVYSTKIFQFIRFFDPPNYGAAAALASVTLVVIAIIYPTQKWLTSRKAYTTVSGSFKPGLIDLGRAQPFVTGGIMFLIVLLTILPILTLFGGSFMTRVGFFNATPMLTTRHWETVLGDRFFIQSLKTTILLSSTTAIVSPLLFSLIAYIFVRTKWRGKQLLEGIFWMSAAVPGILSGLGLLWLFLGFDIGFGRFDLLLPLYGTIYALIMVVVLQGKLTSTQLIKGVYLQMGADMEEAARVAGAGWVRTYFRIWVPLIMPTLILIGTLNFVIAAGATGSIILIASRETQTLSILALDLMTHSTGKQLEAAGIVSLFIVGLTVVVAVVLRRFGLQVGVRHDMKSAKTPKKVSAPAVAAPATLHP